MLPTRRNRNFIVRVDLSFERYKRWVVNIPDCGLNKPEVRKSFYDHKCGGVKGALAAAESLRNNYARKYGLKYARTVPFAPRKPWGRGYYFNKKEKAWLAYWRRDGKQRFKWFSANKYGYERAKYLARQHRHFMVTGSLHIKVRPHTSRTPLL